jgi:hypothetical protein
MVSRAALGTLLAVWLSGTAPAPGAAATDAERGRWRDWTTLRMKARSAPLLRGEVELRLSEEPAGRQLETRTVASFLGAPLARSHTVSVLDPATGRPLEYRSVSKRRGRRYVFGEHGYTVEKLEPPGGGDHPFSSWRVTQRKQFPYPEPIPGATEARPFDYSSLLVALRQLELDEPGDEVTLHVATSNGAQPFRVLVGDSRRTERAYLDLATGRQRRATLRELRLRVIPANPSEANEGFLRMEGETELWVEADSKTPLEISGKVPRVPGRVHLVLTALR